MPYLHIGQCCASSKLSAAFLIAAGAPWCPLLQSFVLQPELADELLKLSDNLVTEAVEFGCALAARRSSKVLRTSDLAMYMQRTYHLHIPGFNKEYTPYRRPVASDLHKARSVAVRKAQLQPQQGGNTGVQGST